MTHALPDVNHSAEPAGIRLGIVRGISYGLFGKPDVFVPQARALGAGLVRAYVYWGQVQPRPDEWVWHTVDALLAQCNGDDELWITLCSSSPWATRRATDFLPPSPAHDISAYAEFVRQMVSRAQSRVHYWQCDNEPSNTALLWAGTAAEYVAQLKIFYQTVKQVDPAAAVVLGGCGYDVFSSAPGSDARQFFDHVVSAGRDAFDLFDAHLYGDPSRDTERLEEARAMMREHGSVKPIVVGEYGGPVPFEFPAAETALQQVMASALAPEEPPLNLSTEALAVAAKQDTPARRAMATLYARAARLPNALQMFMFGCSPALETLRHRINCRYVVMHNLLALAAGVRRTAYWCLGPEVPGPPDPHEIMGLMFGKLSLLDYEGAVLDHRHPAANTFALLAAELAGVQRVERVEVVDRARLHAFRVRREGRPTMMVLWDQRDAIEGEMAPPVSVALDWPARAARVINAFGDTRVLYPAAGELRLPVSATPLFVGVGSEGTAGFPNGKSSRPSTEAVGDRLRVVPR